MQVIGFNFTKILAQKADKFKPNSGINTNIEFTNLEKEKVAALKDSETIKLSFKFEITYEKETNTGVFFEGYLLLLTEPALIKDFQKAWKKKQIPDEYKMSLFNTILSKCTLKALQLEEEVGLPSHIQLPRLAPKPSEQSQ